MTYKDAKWRLEFERNRVCTECDPLGYGCSSSCRFCDTRTAYDTAIEALEKQIPRKPKKIDNWVLCPRCYKKKGFSYNFLVGMKEFPDDKLSYCLVCGQAIDWSEEENERREREE